MKTLDVVLCWHMHQPSYRAADGQYRQPWVYLHAIKDYADMAWHLEHAPGARATVSFAPVLVEQLDDYRAQFESGEFRDPLLCDLQRGDADTPERRRRLCYELCRANFERMVRRFPAYERVFHLAEAAAWGGEPLSPADMADALVWYHLAWLGEGTRRSDERVQRLIAKERGFDAADRTTLLRVVGELVGGVLDRYARLAQQGRIELAVSPYSHPIVPLLIDFRAALEAHPDAALPASPEYPGGAQRADVQLQSAREAHAARFGASPNGCWPSEGGVSDAALAAMRMHDFHWTASGERVCANSLAAKHDDTPREQYLYTPYAVRTGAGPIACFFRDDDLSDRIGFVYATWRAQDAMRDLVDALEAIAAVQAADAAPVVSIILDGENAWEHYEDNAFEFLSALYDRLSDHSGIRLMTFTDRLSGTPSMPALDHVVAGSWVYGSFDTWIGDPDKNRGWDLLVEAKRAYDKTLASGRLTQAAQAAAEMMLRNCESSDWFWWFGGYNPPAPVRDFEQLFRRHLSDLYVALGEPTPPGLDIAVSIGTGDPVYDGVMRRAKRVDLL
jgi:alpha-amylase/alpha-mannosidase (GH57 family)